MLTTRNALLAAGAAVLVAVAGDRAASSADFVNWWPGAGGDIVLEAVPGGHDTNGDTLYFCRVYVSPPSGSAGYQPGKVSRSLGTCNFPYGGNEYTSDQYDILEPHWETASRGQISPSPYRAGTDSDGVPLYFCRAFHLGAQPGKLKPGVGCYFAYGGNEMLETNYYEVLQDDLPMTPSTLNDNEWSHIVGGWESNFSPLLLCIANYNGSTQPGKYLSADGTCHFSYAGVEKLTYDYSLLRVRATSFIYPPPAFDFVVGQDTNGEPLYACWATIDADNNASLQLGKYRRDFGYDGCHVSWGGQEWLGHTASADTQDDLVD